MIANSINSTVFISRHFFLYVLAQKIWGRKGVSMLKLESANHGKMLWTTVGYFLKSEEVISEYYKEVGS